MTQTFMEPTTVTCSAGYDWCDDEPDRGYHTTHFHYADGERYRTSGWEKTKISASLYVDDNESTDLPTVGLIIDDAVTRDSVGEVRLAPAQARKLAADLMNVADLAEPLPAGVMATCPDRLHLGDELLTDDGWQTITGLMIFTDSEPDVQVFTAERDVDNSEGWAYSLEDLVQIRRRMHGSCAIKFVEPIR